MSRNLFPRVPLPVKEPESETPTGSRPKTNIFSVAAAVCAALGFITAIGFVAGVICGHIALAQIRRTREGGRRLALGALIVSWTPLVLVAAIFGMLFLVGVFTAAQGG